MPRGCLDGSTAGALEREVLRLCDAGFSSIAIDLRALQFSEPAGGRLLRRLGELAGRHDVTLAPAADAADEPADQAVQPSARSRASIARDRAIAAQRRLESRAGARRS